MTGPGLTSPIIAVLRCDRHALLGTLCLGRAGQVRDAQAILTHDLGDLRLRTRDFVLTGGFRDSPYCISPGKQLHLLSKNFNSRCRL